MPHAVRMPPLGQTSDELRIVEWLKAEGEPVELGETLLEVETDKATLGVEAVAAGTLLKILHAAGETVESGRVVAYIGEPGEALPAPEPARAAVEVAPPPLGAPSSASAERSRPLATPAARQLARERGVDLGLVEGTGPGGVIEKRDVLAFLER